MKLVNIMFMVVLCFISISIVSCSLPHHVKIKSINEFGDDLKEKYENVEGYEILIEDSLLDFIVELNEPSINSENFIDNLVLNAIVNEVKELFAKEDIQADFIKKYKEYYELGVTSHDGDFLILYPDVKLTIRLIKSESHISYWSRYYSFNLETNSYVIDKYKTWDEPDYNTD